MDEFDGTALWDNYGIDEDVVVRTSHSFTTPVSVCSSLRVLFSHSRWTFLERIFMR